jgi:hypothetical protein
MEKITATDGKTALLRNGQVATIGYIHDMGFRYMNDGQKCDIKLVEFDFEGNGVSDYLFFKDKKLEYHFIDANRPKFIKDLYKEITKTKGANMNAALVVMIYGYVDEKIFGSVNDLISAQK